MIMVLKSHCCIENMVTLVTIVWRGIDEWQTQNKKKHKMNTIVYSHKRELAISVLS